MLISWEPPLIRPAIYWGVVFFFGGGTLDSHDNFIFLMQKKHILSYLCQGLNSHYFHIRGDGHQPNSRGLYTHYKDSY